VLGAGAVAVTVPIGRGGTNFSTRPPADGSAHGANGTSGGYVAPKTTPQPTAVVPTVEASPAVEQPSVVQAESPARVASARARTTSEPRVDDRAFAEELALLDTARSKWRAGNAAGAIESASEYRRRFPAGRFVPEALFLLMQARLDLGQEQAAREVASELVRRFPNTPQVTRAREVLKFDEATQKP
jgi:hypothetical protein